MIANIVYRSKCNAVLLVTTNIYSGELYLFTCMEYPGVPTYLHLYVCDTWLVMLLQLSPSPPPPPPPPPPPQGPTWLHSTPLCMHAWSHKHAWVPPGQRFSRGHCQHGRRLTVTCGSCIRQVRRCLEGMCVRVQEFICTSNCTVHVYMCMLTFLLFCLFIVVVMWYIHINYMYIHVYTVAMSVC